MTIREINSSLSEVFSTYKKAETGLIIKIVCQCIFETYFYKFTVLLLIYSLINNPEIKSGLIEVFTTCRKTETKSIIKINLNIF